MLGDFLVSVCEGWISVRVGVFLAAELQLYKLMDYEVRG